MGSMCSSCFSGESNSDDQHQVITPDADARRRIQEEAAERRRNENESRGIKNVEKVRRAQKKADDLEKAEINYGTNQPTLKWQAN